MGQAASEVVDSVGKAPQRALEPFPRSDRREAEDLTGFSLCVSTDPHREDQSGVLADELVKAIEKLSGNQLGLRLIIG